MTEEQASTTTTTPSVVVVVEAAAASSSSQQVPLLLERQTKTSSHNPAQIRAAKVIGSAWKKCFVSQTTPRLVGHFKDAKLMSTDIQTMR